MVVAYVRYARMFGDWSRSASTSSSGCRSWKSDGRPPRNLPVGTFEQFTPSQPGHRADEAEIALEPSHQTTCRLPLPAAATRSDGEPLPRGRTWSCRSTDMRWRAYFVRAFRALGADQARGTRQVPDPQGPAGALSITMRMKGMHEVPCRCGQHAWLRAFSATRIAPKARLAGLGSAAREQGVIGCVTAKPMLSSSRHLRLVGARLNDPEGVRIAHLF